MILSVFGTVILKIESFSRICVDFGLANRVANPNCTKRVVLDRIFPFA